MSSSSSPVNSTQRSRIYAKALARLSHIQVMHENRRRELIAERERSINRLKQNRAEEVKKAELLFSQQMEAISKERGWEKKRIENAYVGNVGFVVYGEQLIRKTERELNQLTSGKSQGLMRQECADNEPTDRLEDSIPLVRLRAQIQALLERIKRQSRNIGNNH